MIDDIINEIEGELDRTHLITPEIVNKVGLLMNLTEEITNDTARKRNMDE